MTSTHVVLAGGGSAGHIHPALAVADALRRIDPNIGITALGTTRGLDTTLIPQSGYSLELIPSVPLPRKPTLDLVRLPIRLTGAIRRTREILSQVNADVVVGFGGYVSLPAYLAARGRVPIVIHEANARPGLANRVGAKFASQIAVAMPDTAFPDAKVIGIPLRPSIATLDREGERKDARLHFDLDPDLPTLLIFGGSQGARSINSAASLAAGALTRAGIQVLHATGTANTVEVSTPEEAPAYRIVPYLERMELALAAADIALCRSGAMTCAELTAVGLPAAYVPLPLRGGEQRLNAEPIVAAGGGLLVDDAELTSDWIIDHVIPVLSDPQRLAAMSAAAATSGHRDADTKLAQLVLETVGR